MLLMDILLDRLPCGLKVLGCLHGNTTGSWSSGVVAVDQRSREEEEDVDDTDDAEDVAGYKYRNNAISIAISTCYTSINSCKVYQDITVD